MKTAEKISRKPEQDVLSYYLKSGSAVNRADNKWCSSLEAAIMACYEILEILEQWENRSERLREHLSRGLGNLLKRLICKSVQMLPNFYDIFSKHLMMAN